MAVRHKRLTEDELAYVIEQIAAGLETRDIVKAAKADIGLKISPQHVRKIRFSKKELIAEQFEKVELEAIQSGLARRNQRVQALTKLYNQIQEDVFVHGKLWSMKERSIRTDGGYKEIVDIEFNANLSKELRAILDDIAKEVGGRTITADMKHETLSIKTYSVVSPDDWPTPETEKEDESREEKAAALKVVAFGDGDL